MVSPLTFFMPRKCGEAHIFARFGFGGIVGKIYSAVFR